ncbi:MAG TPA: hypothetical protein VF146_07460, partial [Bryobacteraceae bacterium]
SPAIGIVQNGYYTAPPAIKTSQTVTLTATSLAHPNVSASVPIYLLAADNSVAPNSQPSTPSMQLSPSTVSLQQGQTTQFSVSGSSGSLSWSLVPNVGSIANGLYTAPASVTTQTAVTVVASSVSNPSLTASASVTLQPSAASVSLSVSPSTVSLNAGHMAAFSATVSGTSNTGVTWSISPAVGSISNGTYTAPASISSQQVVTVVATSVADPTKSASAIVTLVPISVSLTPSTISLQAAQAAQFMASVTGALNAGVTWSLNPQVGSITNGLYVAPSTISSAQNITVTATSVADPTKAAQAVISLAANVSTSITVSPAQVSLSASQTQQFSATASSGIGGSGQVAVNWSLSPAVGTISSGGLYTAPASISSQQNVTITASGSGATASATVTLTPPTTSSPSVNTAIKLPLELIGPNGMTLSASFNVPAGTNVSGPLTLAMQIHGLRFDGQASVQINGSAWLAISNSTVTLLGQAAAYGGIGGGFHTLQMTMGLPTGVVVTGSNTITFRFNGTDGRVSGFRVLAFNIQDSSGNQFISPSSFTLDDPNTWTPPSSNSTDIAAGQTLWRTAPLTVPTASGSQPILAHCMDCHSQDGRDLKYFNYSNNSIRARSIFHGLSAQQGDQIASYIRTLNVPNPGRPWNPPYQPGSGLDSQPVQNWSAGAGLSAVLNSDQDMMNELFPSGVVPAGFFSPTSVLNVRETAIPLQLPDWNSWLPTIHPMDAWSDFATAKFYQEYLQARSILVPGSPTAYQSAVSLDLSTWGGDYLNFLYPKTNNQPLSVWTPTYVNQVYSTALWTLVKSWELNQEFGLEGMARTVFTNPKAEARAWYSSYPFLASPNMLKIPRGAAGLDNGTLPTWLYLTQSWYQVQLILNNSEYQQNQNSPIDWGYSYAILGNDFSNGTSAPQAALFDMWMAKGIQIDSNGIGPDQWGTGWSWLVADISRQVSPGSHSIWTGTSASTRAAISNAVVQGWLTSVQQFTPQQFWTGGIDGTRLPVHGQPDSGAWEDRIWYMIPQFRYFGVNQTLINQMASWAQTIWPNGNWAATTTATCAPDTAYTWLIRCSTDQ